jgi:alkylhydroperoxidase family enzyme
MDTALPRDMRALAPQAIHDLEELKKTAWACVDPVSLELCRLRIASMLGDAAGLAARTPSAALAGLVEERIEELEHWWLSSDFTDREKARLAYTEQFVVSVSSMEDTHIEALLEFDDHIAVYEFTMAIYVLDMTTRIALIVGAILGAPIVEGSSR